MFAWCQQGKKNAHLSSLLCNTVTLHVTVTLLLFCESGLLCKPTHFADLVLYGKVGRMWVALWRQVHRDLCITEAFFMLVPWCTLVHILMCWDWPLKGSRHRDGHVIRTETQRWNTAQLLFTSWVWLTHTKNVEFNDTVAQAYPTLLTHTVTCLFWKLADASRQIMQCSFQSWKTWCTPQSVSVPGLENTKWKEFSDMDVLGY